MSSSTTTSRSIIRQFRGQHYYLSNFYPATVPFKGLEYPASENAYMAQKSDDLNWKKWCAEPTTKPFECKKESYKQKLVPGWDKMKLQLMEDIIRSKFSDGRLKSLLLGTGDMELQEGNDWGDKYWGVDLSTGVGENHLGKILMKVRAELKQS